MVQQRKRSALIIARQMQTVWDLPQLLFRAGLTVDLLTSSYFMRCSRFVRQVHRIPAKASYIPALKVYLQRHYNWIIPTEDALLAELLHSSLTEQEKLKVLPVKDPNKFCHLYSKTGLATLFSKEGVRTPPFFIAKNRQEAAAQAKELGFPLFVKRDTSVGGNGIIECFSLEDLTEERFSKQLALLHLSEEQFFSSPALVQKKILGREWDFSPLYLEEQLVFCNYARIEKVAENRFGPSCLRTYYPLSCMPLEVFKELRHIGKVLAAHGFTSFSCIESKGNYYYFEADMRRNAWTDFSKFLNHDMALAIRGWFESKTPLQFPVAKLENQPDELMIPYFARLSLTDLLLNRYQVRQFIPKEEPLLRWLVLVKPRLFFLVNSLLAPLVRMLIPQRYHQTLRHFKKTILGL